MGIRQKIHERNQEKKQMATARAAEAQAGRLAMQEKHAEAAREYLWQQAKEHLGELAGRLVIVTNFDGDSEQAAKVVAAIKQAGFDEDVPISFSVHTTPRLVELKGWDEYTDSAHGLHRSLIDAGFNRFITPPSGLCMETRRGHAAAVIEAGEQTAAKYGDGRTPSLHLVVTSALLTPELNVSEDESLYGGAFLLQGFDEQTKAPIWDKVASPLFETTERTEKA